MKMSMKTRMSKMFVQFADCNSITDFRQFKLSSADERALWPGRDLLSTVNYYREFTFRMQFTFRMYESSIRYRCGSSSNERGRIRSISSVADHFNTFHAFVSINSFRYSGQVRKVDGGTIVPARFKSFEWRLDNVLSHLSGV